MFFIKLIVFWSNPTDSLSRRANTPWQIKYSSKQFFIFGSPVWDEFNLGSKVVLVTILSISLSKTKQE